MVTMRRGGIGVGLIVEVRSLLAEARGTVAIAFRSMLIRVDRMKSRVVGLELMGKGKVEIELIGVTHPVTMTA